MKIVKISIVLIVMLALIYLAYIYLIKPSDTSTEKTVEITPVSTVNTNPKKYLDLGKTYTSVVNKDLLLNVVSQAGDAGNGRG